MNDISAEGIERVKFSDGNLFGEGRWRKECRGNFSKHSFASAWRARKEQIVLASNSYDKCALGGGLPKNIV